MTLRSALVLVSLILSAPWMATPAIAQSSLAEPPEDAGGGEETGQPTPGAPAPAEARGGGEAGRPISPFERARQDSAARAMESYRERVVVVYGKEACPRPTRPDEVIVCARRPAEDQFRIPPALRTEPGEGETDAAERRAAIVAPTGVASGCNETGPNPGPGCMTQAWSQGPRLRDTARLLLEGAQVTRIMPDGTEVPY
jgi:hypothetical protein